MTPFVRTHGLIFRRPGFTLGPLDLDLGPGLYHLVGPNGAGKTTLLHLLCGLLRPAEGTVALPGGPPTRPRARRDVAYLPAEPDLPDFLTVDEAWRLLAGLRDPAWEGAPLLRALGLPADRRLDRLSAGQRQQAELVAALAGDPTILLLDEPIAHMDADCSELVLGWLRRWSTERVVLVVAHDLDVDAVRIPLRS